MKKRIVCMLLMALIFSAFLFSCYQYDAFGELKIDKINLRDKGSQPERLLQTEPEVDTEEIEKEIEETESAESEPVEQGQLYQLTVVGEEWLYEPLKPAYPAGTEVFVKVKPGDMDTIAFASVNGKKNDFCVNIEDRSYSYFTFTMPEDSLKIYIISHKNYRGPEVPFAHAVPFLRTYWAENPEYSCVEFRKFYGYYGRAELYDIKVAMMKSHSEQQETTDIWFETVAECNFEYRDQDRIWVYRDLKIYTLTEAYDQGIINSGEVAQIAEIHAQSLDQLYT